MSDFEGNFAKVAGENLNVDKREWTAIKAVVAARTEKGALSSCKISRKDPDFLAALTQAGFTQDEITELEAEKKAHSFLVFVDPDDVQAEPQIYAMSRGKNVKEGIAGSGSFKLVKNVVNENGEFFVVAITSTDAQSPEETSIMKTHGDLIGQISKTRAEPTPWVGKHKIKDKLYLIEKKHPGVELYKYLNPETPRITPLTFEEKLNIVKSIFEAVQKMHAENIVHADLKLENIIYDPETNTAVIIDFGFSMILPESKQDINLANLKGTPGFIAPEIIESRVYSKSSDMFAVGMILAEIILKPYSFESLYDHSYDMYKMRGPITIQKFNNLVKEIERAYNGSTEQPIIELMVAMLNTGPQQRPTIEQALKGINECLRIIDQSKKQDETIATAQPGTRSSSADSFAPTAIDSAVQEATDEQIKQINEAAEFFKVWSYRVSNNSNHLTDEAKNLISIIGQMLQVDENNHLIVSAEGAYVWKSYNECVQYMGQIQKLLGNDELRRIKVLQPLPPLPLTFSDPNKRPAVQNTSTSQVQTAHPSVSAKSGHP